MRAAVYLRVSDPAQAGDDHYSLPTQERTCLAVATARGDEVVAIYEDAGATAYRDELEHRPEFQRLLQDAPAHQWGRLYVLALDRFSRASMAASGEWLRILERAGVELISALEWFDSSPSGELLRTILLGQAHFFSRLQGQRVSGALRLKQAGGGWVGVKPWGYRGGPDKTLRVDEAAAAGYRLAVKLVLEGEENISQVCRMLNAAGYRTTPGGPWHAKALFKVLRSPAYLGVVVLPDGTLLPGRHPPLLERAEWELLQQRLQASARPHAGRRPRACYPLSGILHCGYCGAPLIGASPADRRPCYTCAQRNKLHACHGGICYLHAAACEELVAEILDGVTLGPGWREAVEKALAAPPPPGPSLSEIKRQEARLMDMYQLGIFQGDKAEFKRRWDELQALRETQAGPARQPVLAVGALLEAGLGNLWRATANAPAQRKLARLLFRAVYVVGITMDRAELSRPVEWQPAVALLLRLCGGE